MRLPSLDETLTVNGKAPVGLPYLGVLDIILDSLFSLGEMAENIRERVWVERPNTDIEVPATDCTGEGCGSEDDLDDDDDDPRDGKNAAGGGNAQGTCTFGSKFSDNLGLLHESALAGAAHVFHAGEAAVGTVALVAGAQALSTGLQGSSPFVIETGVELAKYAATRVPHIVVGMAVVEAGFWVGSGFNAGYSVLSGSCQ